MVSIGILTLTLIVSAVLIILGFIFKKKAYFATIAGSIVLVIVGISLLGNGISFVSGTNETIVDNVTTITINQFTNQQDVITEMLGWVIMLVGFIGFIGGAMALNKTRFDDDDLDNRVDDDFRY